MPFDFIFDLAHVKATTQSEQMRHALNMTGTLWARSLVEWPTGDINRCHSDLEIQSSSQMAFKYKVKKQLGKAKKEFATAYAKWNKGDALKWMKKLQSSDHALNKEQESFMHRVIHRCQTEAQELSDSNSKKSEPLRDCLLGFPGTGKSECIKTMRRFFQEVLHWETGIQFQFSASQNTMAALIEGQTIHSWGGIPVGAETVYHNESKTDMEEGVDHLFQNVVTMRFLVLDELSTISPTLLGLLEAHLRRVCIRHPYAKREKHARPFGGLNIIFCGDFWQLPPVKALSIFSNPFCRSSGKTSGYSFQEQKILQMFFGH